MKKSADAWHNEKEPQVPTIVHGYACNIVPCSDIQGPHCVCELEHPLVVVRIGVPMNTFGK